MEKVNGWIKSLEIDKLNPEFVKAMQGLGEEGIKATKFYLGITIVCRSLVKLADYIARVIIIAKIPDAIAYFIGG